MTVLTGKNKGWVSNLSQNPMAIGLYSGITSGLPGYDRTEFQHEISGLRLCYDFSILLNG